MNTPTRREFAQALAVLGLAAMPAAAQPATPIPTAKEYAAALETVLRYRYGRQLTEDQVPQIVASLAARRFSGDALKRIELENGEDPIEAFRADVP